MQYTNKKIFYVQMLEEVLEKKNKLLDNLLLLTKKQSEVLSQDQVDYTVIDALVSQKNDDIQQILLIDDGFQRLYENVKHEIKDNKERFQHNIVAIQKWIKIIVEKGMILRELENQNKALFERYIIEEKKKIGTFKKSNTVATAYYKSMINMQTNESYFLDKKK